MKDLIIKLSFVAMFAGACMSAKEREELKPVFVVLKASYEKSRQTGEGYKERLVFIYKGDNNIEYEVEYYLGDRGVLYVPR